jgi:hypothetical protein
MVKLHPDRKSGSERGFAASRPIGSDKTIGGWKGCFRKFRIPLFPSSSLHEPVWRTEGNKKSKKQVPPKLTGLASGFVNSFVTLIWAGEHSFGTFFALPGNPKTR